MRAKTLFKKLGYSKIVNNNEEIFYKEIGYGDEERIIFDFLNNKIYKQIFAFPRIDIVEFTKEEKVAVDLRLKELQNKNEK